DTGRRCKQLDEFLGAPGQYPGRQPAQDRRRLCPGWPVRYLLGPALYRLKTQESAPPKRGAFFRLSVPAVAKAGGGAYPPIERSFARRRHVYERETVQTRSVPAADGDAGPAAAQRLRHGRKGFGRGPGQAVQL